MQKEIARETIRITVRGRLSLLSFYKLGSQLLSCPNQRTPCALRAIPNTKQSTHPLYRLLSSGGGLSHETSGKHSVLKPIPQFRGQGFLGDLLFTQKGSFTAFRRFIHEPTFSLQSPLTSSDTSGDSSFGAGIDTMHSRETNTPYAILGACSTGGESMSTHREADTVHALRLITIAPKWRWRCHLIRDMPPALPALQKVPF